MNTKDKTRVLALCGEMGAGKTTLAAAIKREYANQKLLQISFSEPIKKALLAMAGLPLDNWYELFQSLKNEEFLGTSKTWRYSAQTLGTEWGRELIDPDIWIKAAIRRIMYYQVAVVDDLRFHNELRGLRSNFTVLTFRLHPMWKPPTKSNSTHLSEQEWKTMPHVDADCFMPDEKTTEYGIYVCACVEYLKTGIKPFAFSRPLS